MLISLVIPTRERAELLGPCLDAALAIDDPGLEIVVSDNASADGTAELVSSLTDSRLRYVNTGQRVSMRQNFETALAAATGEYVIFIGDDDGIYTGGLALLRDVIERERPEAVSWDLVHYTWPSTRPGHECGFINIKAQNVFGGIRHKPAPRLLDDFCQARIRNYKDGANIYHGCISRDLIETVRNANGGTYFGGAIPDVYACIANLAHLRSDLLWLRHPVTFGGASDRSNGAAQTGAAKAPASGAAETRRFVREAGVDRDAAGIDLAVPSLDALTLDMLEVFNRSAGNGVLPIDRAAWLDRIMRRLSRMPRPKYDRGFAALAAYCERMGTESLFETANGHHPFSGSDEVSAGARPVRSRVSPLKITLAHPSALASVRDAADALQEVLGDDHRCRAMGLSRWARWLRAIRRAAWLVRGWKTTGI